MKPQVLGNHKRAYRVKKELLMSQWLIVILMLLSTTFIVMVIIMVNKFYSRKLKNNPMYETVRVCSSEHVDTTVQTKSPLSIDGVILEDNDTVLLTRQKSGSDNGIWVYHSIKGWQRNKRDKVIIGSMVYILEGETYSEQKMILHVNKNNEVYFEPWLDMVYGYSKVVDRTTSKLTYNVGDVRPRWVPDEVQKWGTCEKLSYSIHFKKNSINIHTIELDTKWFNDSIDNLWFLYVYGSSAVYRYEILTNFDADTLRMILLKSDKFLSSNNNKEADINLRPPEKGWWNPQEKYELVLSIDNSVDLDLNCRIKLIQVTNAIVS